MLKIDTFIVLPFLSVTSLDKKTVSQKDGQPVRQAVHLYSLLSEASFKTDLFLFLVFCRQESNKFVIAYWLLSRL